MSSTIKLEIVTPAGKKYSGDGVPQSTGPRWRNRDFTRTCAPGYGIEDRFAGTEKKGKKD